MPAEPRHIRSHIEVAPSLRVSPSEILEAIEIAPRAGRVVAFHAGLGFWEAIGTAPLETFRDVTAGQGAEPQA
jgi:4-carboxymuconolactone decarboxylase